MTIEQFTELLEQKKVKKTLLLDVFGAAATILALLEETNASSIRLDMGEKVLKIELKERKGGKK